MQVVFHPALEGVHKSFTGKFRMMPEVAPPLRLKLPEANIWRFHD